ncbi:hypothetical protein RchiOBHm_Chr2g0135311 [Rosa chinensis]|uniref:Uncharacterized protein n=1 Tax=Rosa chinensis TaxID=74649 RepID=A0A2P6RW22_ROSCH|nr:hypothetical protein RchiOBHm_Chr2g0135311 [Rosa chinensis]
MPLGTHMKNFHLIPFIGMIMMQGDNKCITRRVHLAAVESMRFKEHHPGLLCMSSRG